MALSSTILESDAAFIVKEDIPVTITLSGSSYTGTRMSVRQARDSALEGQRDRYAFSVYLLISDLSALPSVDDLATIASVEYLIMGMDTDDIQQILRLDLAEKFNGGGI
jgi:hypothetical protein